MSKKTDYIANNDNYTNKDLYDIFQPIGSATQNITTGYKVNNSDFQNKDLGEIFLGYTTGAKKAKVTGYKVDGIDLADKLERVSPSFTKATDSADLPAIETLNGFENYFMMKFTTTNVNTTYKFYPNTPINVYQLFVVGGGGTGGKAGGFESQIYGGRGGLVTGYNYNITSVGNYTTVSNGPSNLFTLIVGTGNQDSKSEFVGTTAPTTSLDFTATGRGGSSNDGTTNFFTNLPYGGAGGSGNWNLPIQRKNGYSGGGGGAGGSYHSSNAAYYVAGGQGANGGGNGGRGNSDPILAVNGSPGSGPGGGAAGLAQSGGGGGGGGGAGGYGGGGGGGGFASNTQSGGGGGGSGVIILIFTT
jgi:hypothetical protein